MAPPISGTVYDYCNEQQEQLVDLAISRVTTLDGLNMSNENGQFKFHYAKGSSLPSVEETRDEDTRLE